MIRQSQDYLKSLSLAMLESCDFGPPWRDGCTFYTTKLSNYTIRIIEIYNLAARSGPGISDFGFRI